MPRPAFRRHQELPMLGERRRPTRPTRLDLCATVLRIGGTHSPGLGFGPFLERRDGGVPLHLAHALRHAPKRQHLLKVLHRRVRAHAIRLVDGEHVGHLENAGLDRLNVVAQPRRHHNQRRVGQPRHLELVLPNADGFEQYHVELRRM